MYTCVASMLALGALQSTSSVVSSTATAFFTSLRYTARLRSFSMMVLKVHATSRAVSGSPSCHLTPGRILKVQVFWSGESDQSSARPVSLEGRPSAPMATSVS